MVIKSLKLCNYRNYENLFIDLDEHLNIFIGDNAQGKSNLLESVVVLAITKSYMNVKDKNLIKNGEDFTLLSAKVSFDGVIDELLVSFSENVKKLKINNVEIKKYSDYISKIRFVLFSPYDVGIFKESPSVRRKLFNIEISQLSNKYVKLLQKYNAILKKRNQFLKYVKETGKKDNLYLEIINNKFCSLAVDIVVARQKFVDDINKSLGSIYEEITDFSGLVLKYNSTIECDIDKLKMKDLMLMRLKDNFEREVMYGMTFIGPHRDDYSLFLEEQDLSIYGSQGQNRLAILALKLSEISIFKEVTNEYPILLLDDVFSELDVKKRNRIVKYILNDVQTIITTTDLNMIDEKIIKKARIFEINSGNVVFDNKEEGMQSE